MQKAYSIVQLTLSFVIRILNMSENRLPKICVRRLIEIAASENCDIKHNWAAQLREILRVMDCHNIINNINAIY